MGKHFATLVESGRQDEEFHRRLVDTISSGKVWRGELVSRRKSGELFDEEMTITPVVDEHRRIEHFIAIRSDVTERTASRQRLEASLREKDVLLREVHHRVKNNMQVISSLLSLSGGMVKDDSFVRTIDEVSRRIEAMAIVHEQFYESTDLARIDFTQYLRQLASTLAEQYCEGAPRPEFEIAAAQVHLSLDEAIPAGLVVSEFISNALRYAFRESSGPGTVKISLESEAGSLSVEVRDDGIGLPQGFDKASANTLGMRLVAILAEQLRGTVSYANEGGAVATLRFPFSERS